MAAYGVSRRFRRFIQLVARLAVLAYVFQMAAVDHWHAAPTNLIGIEGTSLHVYHCHGGGDGCSDSSGLSGSLAEASLTPLAPDATAGDTAPIQTSPAEVFLPQPQQPPRAA